LFFHQSAFGGVGNALGLRFELQDFSELNPHGGLPQLAHECRNIGRHFGNGQVLAVGAHDVLFQGIDFVADGGRVATAQALTHLSHGDGPPEGRSRGRTSDSGLSEQAGDGFTHLGRGGDGGTRHGGSKTVCITIKSNVRQRYLTTFNCFYI
jgi:hypothetical protein